MGADSGDVITGPNGEEYAWYQCTVKGGTEGRPIGAYELAQAVEELGAREILLNCIDCDGLGQGFDTDLVVLVSEAVSIPVIASSGAGAVENRSRTTVGKHLFPWKIPAARAADAEVLSKTSEKC